MVSGILLGGDTQRLRITTKTAHEKHVRGFPQRSRAINLVGPILAGMHDEWQTPGPTLPLCKLHVTTENQHDNRLTSTKAATARQDNL